MRFTVRWLGTEVQAARRGEAANKSIKSRNCETHLTYMKGTRAQQTLRFSLLGFGYRIFL